MTTRVNISVGKIRINRHWDGNSIVTIYDHLPRLYECCEGRYGCKSSPKLAVNVGVTIPEKRKSDGNKQTMQEGYSAQITTTGFRAHARGDMLEGRRTDLFMNRVNDFYGDKQSHSQASRIKRLRRLERRGIILEALVDSVPSLFSSIWRILPMRR